MSLSLSLYPSLSLSLGARARSLAREMDEREEKDQKDEKDAEQTPCQSARLACGDVAVMLRRRGFECMYVWPYVYVYASVCARGRERAARTRGAEELSSGAKIKRNDATRSDGLDGDGDGDEDVLERVLVERLAVGVS